MTVAQRARLVVAMGLLNIILATVALTAGIVGPTRPDGQIAEGSRPPSPTAVPTLPGSSAAPTPGATDPGPVPTPSDVLPSSDPGTEPSPSAPASAPASAPPASEPPTVATGSTPPVNGRPEPVATREPTAAPPVAKPTAQPTPRATPRATPRPTPRPTPTPEPAAGKVRKAAPPCPTKGGTPPGHQKVQPPPERPCGNGSSNGKSGGVVLVLPLLAGGLIGGARTITRTVRTGRLRKD